MIGSHSNPTTQHKGRHRPPRKGNEMATEAQRGYVKKYDKMNTTHLHLKLNLKTDKDILERLDQVESKQGYIKRLIREDIKKGL